MHKPIGRLSWFGVPCADGAEVGGKKRKGSPGHYCWVCERCRPNEKFSGKGHRRHVCKDCAKLGPDGLAYRRSVLALERCVTREGFIPRRQRASFERFLQHDDLRIRAMAERLQQADKENRERWRAEREAEDLVVGFDALVLDGDDAGPLADDDLDYYREADDSDIPF